MSQQSRILAGVFCSGMAAALIAMAALQLPNWLQDGEREPAGGADCRTRADAGAAGYRGPHRAARRYPGTAGFYRTAGA